MVILLLLFSSVVKNYFRYLPAIHITSPRYFCLYFCVLATLNSAVNVSSRNTVNLCVIITGQLLLESTFLNATVAFRILLVRIYRILVRISSQVTNLVYMESC